MKQATPDSLLAKEYITPDFQCIDIRQPVKSILVCFTGNGHRLNMPVQLFHQLARPVFDRIIYLRDKSLQGYSNGIAVLGSNLEATLEAVHSYVPDNSFLSVIGTSSGCIAASHFAHQYRADRLGLFSPRLEFKGTTIASGWYIKQPEDILISTSAFSCSASYEIPAPVVLDACS